MTLLSGVYILEKDDGGAVETFDLIHSEIEGLRLASATLCRWKKGKYLLVSRGLYYIGRIDGAKKVTPLSRQKIAFWAWLSVFPLVGRLAQLKLCLKGWLRNNPTDFEDALSYGWTMKWEENKGVVREQQIVFGFGERLPRVLGTLKTGLGPGARVALYAHHDALGQFSSVDQNSLRFLHQQGFQVIVLSTSVGPRDYGNIPGLLGWLFRPNVGHDFFSWKLALDEFQTELSQVEQVVFTNNSMVISGTKTLESLAAMDSPFVCLTGSLQVRPHAESTWWQFRRQHEIWASVEQFFASVEALPGKQAIIRRYEIGLSEFLESGDYQFQPLFPYEVLEKELSARQSEFPVLYRRAQREGALNPSKHLYDLLRALGVDILKKTDKLQVA